MSDVTSMPTVEGRCPACRGRTLFVGAGGYVTCSWLTCPNPTIVSEMLEPDAPADAVVVCRGPDGEWPDWALELCEQWHMPPEEDDQPQEIKWRASHVLDALAEASRKETE